MYRGSLTASADPALKKTKTCPRCRRPLSIEEFDPNRARRDGRQTHCRRCRKRQRDLLRNGNGANGNGHVRTNGNGSRLKREDEEEAGEDKGSYTPTWKKPKVSRKELLLQRERYMNIINAASLALERIEMRLGISDVEPVEDAPEEKEPADVQEDLAEDLEDDLE